MTVIKENVLSGKVLVYQVLGAILLSGGNFNHTHQRSLVGSQKSHDHKKYN